jgi:hypothetical protein
MWMLRPKQRSLLVASISVSVVPKRLALVCLPGADQRVATLLLYTCRWNVIVSGNDHGGRNFDCFVVSSAK